MKKLLIFLPIIIFFFGCATFESLAPDLEEKNTLTPVSVWNIAYKGEDFRDDNKVTGVIIFTKESTRKSFICEQLIKSIPHESTVKTESEKRVTYWFSSRKRPSASIDESNCDNLLQEYDYERAKALLDTINKTHNSMPITGEGPIFVGFTGKKDGNILVINGSQTSDDEMNALINQWKEKIIQDKKLWDGFKSDVSAGTTTAKASKAGISVKAPDGAESKSAEDKPGFWLDFWNTIKPALQQILVASVPIVITLIKVAAGIPV